MRRPLPPIAAAVLAGVLATATLAGCSAQVAATPAKYSNDPLCAAVTVHLPSKVQELDERETNAQATGAWGDPAKVLLTCGVTVPSRSELPCVKVNGVFWLRNDDQKKDGVYVYTTYGRTPAIDVAIQQGQNASPGNVLFDLTDAVRETTSNGLKCLSVEDTLN